MQYKITSKNCHKYCEDYLKDPNLVSDCFYDEGGNKIEDVVLVIRLISFALLVIPMLSIKRGYLQGLRFIREPSISQVIEQLVRIVVIIVGSYLCVYIFHAPIKYAVGISVFAATLGGIATFIYLIPIIYEIIT